MWTEMIGKKVVSCVKNKKNSKYVTVRLKQEKHRILLYLSITLESLERLFWHSTRRFKSCHFAQFSHNLLWATFSFWRKYSYFFFLLFKCYFHAAWLEQILFGFQVCEQTMLKMDSHIIIGNESNLSIFGLNSWGKKRKKKEKVNSFSDGCKLHDQWNGSALLKWDPWIVTLFCFWIRCNSSKKGT